MLFSGDPDIQWLGVLLRASELNARLDGPFDGRNVVSVGGAFGEPFYYSTINPATGIHQRKVTPVKSKRSENTLLTGMPSK